jgi:hypothetical protein
MHPHQALAAEEFDNLKVQLSVFSPFIIPLVASFYNMFMFI